MSATLFRELLQSRATYIALMLLGAGLFGFFLYEDYQLDRIRNKYEPTPCEIVSADIEEHVTHGRRGGRTVTYHFRVKYVYRVAGKPYTGTTYRHGDWGMTRQEAIAAADKYEPSRARCFVDPDNPENAVLSQESGKGGLTIAAFLGMLALAMGLGGWVVLEFVVKRSSGSDFDENAEPTPVEVPAWSAVAKWQSQQTPHEQVSRQP